MNFSVLQYLCTFSYIAPYGYFYWKSFPVIHVLPQSLKLIHSSKPCSVTFFIKPFLVYYLLINLFFHEFSWHYCASFWAFVELFFLKVHTFFWKIFIKPFVSFSMRPILCTHLTLQSFPYTYKLIYSFPSTHQFLKYHTFIYLLCLLYTIFLLCAALKALWMQKFLSIFPLIYSKI